MQIKNVLLLKLLIILVLPCTLYSQTINYPTPYTITTISGQVGYGYSDGIANIARYNQPQGIVCDKSGNIYVADCYNYTIRQISTSGIVKTVAGQSGNIGTNDGTGSYATFGVIGGITIDNSGNLYITDLTFNTVRKISADTWTVTTIIPTSYGLVEPASIAIDSMNNIYVADTGNYVIRKITPQKNISIVAGHLGDRTGSSGSLGYVAGIAIDSKDNIYLLDTQLNQLFRISTGSTMIAIGGYFGSAGFLDGPLTTQQSQFNHPLAIACDNNSNLYIIDGSAGTLLRKISADGIVSTLAGSNLVGGKDGTGGTASFSNASGLTTDSSGNIYISNTGTSTIRKASLLSSTTPPVILINPYDTIANLGYTTTLTVNAAGAGSLRYQWYFNNIRINDGNNITGANTSTLVISNISSEQIGPYTVSITNNIGSTLSNTVYIQLPISFTTQPKSQQVLEGSAVTFAANTNDLSASYQWMKDGQNIVGAISKTFSIFNAKYSNAGVYTVKANNRVSSSTSIGAVLSILNPIIINQPKSQAVNIGNPLTFTVSANGPNLSYQWFFNDFAIPNTNSSTYTISNVQQNNVGLYKVNITNQYGSITSEGATIQLIQYNARLTNLSVMSLDGPGAQLLTVGFVTGGIGTTGSQNLLIRACGPASGEAPFYVANALTDPTLSVFNSSTSVLASNDNWGTPASNANAVTTADAATGAFALTSTTSLDAALVASLTPGSYTVQVAGKNGATGNVIAEVYDNTTTSTYTNATPRLVNLSCLEQVSAGGVLSAGFVIGGFTEERVLIRASGPTLTEAPFKIPGMMQDPQLTVFSSSSAVLGTNTGWGGNVAITAANLATGAFEFIDGTSNDSAVVLTLQPGAYSVQVKSKSNSMGKTLIEIYEIPNK